MAQFNFGQVLAQSAASAADRAQQAQARALQVQQQIEERELEREIQRAQQQFRQQQLNQQGEKINADIAFNLASLRQERQQNQFERTMTRKNFGLDKNRVQKLNEKIDAEIEALENEEDDDGVDPNTRLNALLSSMRTAQNMLKMTGEEKAAIRPDVMNVREGKFPSGLQPLGQPTGFFGIAEDPDGLFGPTQQEVSNFQADTAAFRADSAATEQEFSDLEQREVKLRSQIDRIRNMIQRQLPDGGNTNGGNTISFDEAIGE